MSTPVGNLVKTKVTSVIESFGNGAEAKLIDSFNTISLSDQDNLSENNKTLTIAIDDGLRFLGLAENEDSLPSSFSIAYTDGMTWGEWVNSEYNNIQFTLYCSGEGYVVDESATVKLKFELVEYENAIKLKITTFIGPAFDVVYKEVIEGAYVEIFDTYEVVNLTDEIDSTKDYVLASY